jgi:ferredoxin-NADP reductase/ABC-type transport system involved in cytochrome c biogenesis permease subunit
MPLDTFARLTLYELSGRRRVSGQGALPWLARVLFRPDTTADDPVFLVNHPDAATALGLTGLGRGRYSYSQLEPGVERLADLARKLGASDDQEVDLAQADLLRLFQAVTLYRDLRGALDFARPDPSLDDLSLTEVLNTGGAPSSDTEMVARAQLRWTGRGWQNPFRVVPGDNTGTTWLSPEAALLEGDGPAVLASHLGRATFAWEHRDWDAAQRALELFRVGALERAARPDAGLALEVFYNQARPFLISGALAVCALLAQALSRRYRWPGLLPSALLAAALTVHTAGLVVRVLVTGRPPVTSLYTSFVFVAWVAMALGLYLRLARNEDLGLVVGTVGGILLTLLSSKFAAEGDQLGVLQAVLDTNFWLATHVVTITAGYGGCVVAGLLGHLYLLRSILQPWEEDTQAALYRLIYGSLVFSLILTFLGTVLGGIWADQSWGRFWGWDPKENGALMIVLWIAIVLHARLARIIEPRGVAGLSVTLILVVLFSWLGVNLMGVGLHSYGWTRGMGLVVVAVAGAEVLFLAVCWPLAGGGQRGPRLKSVRVSGIRRETPDTVTVSLALGRGERISAAPGRYVTLFALVRGFTYRRAYSLSWLDERGTHFDITVRTLEDGTVSPWIERELRLGARLAVAGPSGTFGLDGEAADRDGPGPVFVAGGSGIAPLAPMAERYFLDGGRRLLLVYGSRDERHIIFRDRMERLRTANPGLTVRHVLAEPAADWTGERGRITGPLVVSAAGVLPGRTFYLCGPEPMVDEVRAGLLDAGVDPSRVREERFAPATSDSARRTGRGGMVRFSASRADVRVRAGQSILEAGLRAGLSLPGSCMAGRCRDCAALLVRGLVRMEEPNTLTAAEREQGVILPCSSYPEGEVTVDL